MKLPPSMEHPELDALIEKARVHTMTPQEKWLQRVSFVYGNLPDDSTTTREQVEAIITTEYGPCPSE
jgi:hypothetical protein